MELVFWWNSACRSVMPLFRELANLADTRVKIVVREALSQVRQRMKWQPDDSGAAVLTVLPSAGWQRAAEDILRSERDALHVFGEYQRNEVIRHAAKCAIAQGIRFGVMTEAPLNMHRGPARVAKSIYLRSVVPFLTGSIAHSARFVLCLSGRRFAALEAAGWSAPKIYPFGYFPTGRPSRARSAIPAGHPVRILSTGVLAPFKGTDLLLDALARLRDRDIHFVCDIVGDGPEKHRLERQARTLGLTGAVSFHGFVSDSHIEGLVRESDILVCAGREEPWAIRVNEGLLAGMPVVVSDRIGASELIAASGAGAVFRSGDPGDLAECLASLVEHPNTIGQLKRRAISYSALLQPAVAARHFMRVVEHSLSQATRSSRPSCPWHLPDECLDQPSAGPSEFLDPMHQAANRTIPKERQ